MWLIKMLCAIKQRGNFILSNERGQEYKFSDLKRTAPTRKAVFTTVFENSPPKSKINSGRCNRYACFYIGRAVLDTHKTRVSMLTWLVLSYPQKAHTHTDTELCIRSKKTFCDRRREQNIVLHKRSLFSTNVGEGHSRLSFIPAETKTLCFR